ncbi:uncharacterized protein [Diabrotica undecimpunctata]|uniref:uncharacterized protein n=1 Tax=Diabrotica undecimpunctata TaxID=50387 RepID=UPI003B63A1FE
MLTRADFIEEAQEIFSKVSKVLESGCFHLRQWCSNSSNVLKDIPKSESAFVILEFLSVDNKTKTLGLIWSCSSNSLCYNINTTLSKQVIAKRSVLSLMANIFDPLGLLSPCTIIGKIIMQHLWCNQLSWDNNLPEELYSKWINLQNELPLLHNLSISRHAILCNPTELQLHGFCDASERAYGACVYIRSSDKHGKVQVSLLCAKTKVAPVKTISIPRLELCGALLLARLVDKVKTAINLQFN